MGTSVQGARQGGCGLKGVKGVLYRRDTGCFALWVGDVGSDGEDGEEPGQFSVHGRAEDLGEAATAREGQELLLPFVGVSNEGDRDGLNTDVNPPEAEYGSAIYCDVANSGPMQKFQ